MANLNVHNYHKLRLLPNLSKYWDFYADFDHRGKFSHWGILDDSCCYTDIDLSDSECIGDNNWIFGKKDYSWSHAVSNGITLNNIGFTGVDNGLISYRRDRIMNNDFVKIYQNSSFSIEEGDKRLQMHPVSGTTSKYDYPLSYDGTSYKLNGGFFQGFFKTKCTDYQILPSTLEGGDEWILEFDLKKCDLESESNKTLNDSHPDNKGIFFYIGTRAENKWVYLYNESGDSSINDDCLMLGADDYVEGGEISKKEYGITNFLDTDIDWVDDDLNFDDYTDYRYYDLPDSEISTIGSIHGQPQNPFIDDETTKYQLIGNCCCKDKSHEEGAKVVRYVKIPYVSCGCGIRYRDKKIIEPYDNKCSDGISNNDFFGDEYLTGFDGLSCDFDYVEADIDITDFEYTTDNGLSLEKAGQYYFYTDNKFMMFDRTCDGYNVSNWVEGTKMMYYGTKNRFKGNLFILMNRTCTGYNVNTIQELIEKENQHYDSTYSDIYNNALAFMIDDNGAIGYRMLTVDCDSQEENNTMILSGMSYPNEIRDCEWEKINVRLVAFDKKMRIMFYVNNKLVYVTSELPKISLRELNDVYEKQEGVPFNISLGGGTQGLAETVLPNYMLDAYREYPLEKYFAGSFIGYIKGFKFYGPC